MNSRMKAIIIGAFIGFLISTFLFAPFNIFEPNVLALGMRLGCIFIIVVSASIGFTIADHA